MRKLVLGGLLLLGAATVNIGRAAPVLAPPSPQCSLFGTGPANDISIPFATWSAAGFNCEQFDKIYSNFSVTGMPVDTVLEVQEQVLSGIDLHAVTFNSNFLNPFLVSYDIAVDLTLSPFARIVRVSGDLSNPSNIGTPSNTKGVFSEGGAPLGTLVSTSGSPGTPLVVSVTALHAIDSYVPNGGGAVSVSNVYAEAVPEPVTASLIGGALLVLARLKRRVA